MFFIFIDQYAIHKRTAGIMANDNAQFLGNSINTGAIMGEGGTISGGNIIGRDKDVAPNIQGETGGKHDYDI